MKKTHTPASALRMLLLSGALALSTGLGSFLNAAPAEFDEQSCTTIFAFDNTSIPFTQHMRMEMRTPEKYPGNPVVRRGGPEAPDSWAVQFYGSVIKIDGKYRMWYVSAGADRLDKTQDRSAPWRVAYAESVDGINWEKPNLGLVDYMGNKNNNLVQYEPSPLGILNLKVLYEPECPDPSQRYKMTAHVWFAKGKKNVRLGTLALFTSPDGLRWKMIGDNPKPLKAELMKKDMVLPFTHFEPCGGLYKWDGVYYISGQNANRTERPYHGRVVRTFASGDFKTWTQSSSVGFVRYAQHTLLGPGKSRDGEQTHEGISVWNRGNILLGVYGIWHGSLQWRNVSIDLGFVMSHDGVNFREPVNEMVFIKRGKDGQWDQGGLIQAQGFENINDKTYIYYGAWDPRGWEGSPPRGGVGIVTLPRDRFADLVEEKAMQGDGDYQVPVADATPEFITAAIPMKGGSAQQFFLNADGLGFNSTLKVELLGKDFRPLPGYSGKDAALMRKGGFHVPVEWKSGDTAKNLPDDVRIRVRYEGNQRANIRFSALYIKPAK